MMKGCKTLLFPQCPQKPAHKIVLTEQILGKGQYGTVHFAFSTEDKTRVYAIKCLDRKRIQSEKELQNLQNEIAIMAEIKSPYVVGL